MSDIIEEVKEEIVEEAEPPRKMASIQKIDKLTPISFTNKETKEKEIAGAIETAHVMGWTVVVKKGQFKENDLAVFIEVQSVLPYTYWSAFLDKHDRKQPILLKTIRLKEQLSQGLLVPISDIRELDGLELVEGMDLTSVLNITKKPDIVDISIRGICRSTRPAYVPKTDENSLQNNKHYLEEFKGHEVYITQKIDGSSFSCCYKDNDIHVTSRNMDLKDGENAFWHVAKEHDLPNKLKAYFEKTGIELIVQGEVAGPSIQKNRLGLTKPTLYVFSIINVSGQVYFSFNEFMAFCKEMSLPTVPILKECIFGWNTVQELLDESVGIYPNGFPQEGIVIRKKINLNNGKMDSFKVINNIFREKTEG